SQLRITRNRVAQFLFARCERRPGLWIEEASQITIVAFPVVLIAEKIIARFSCVLERARAIRELQHLAPVKHAQDVNQISIAGIGQLIQAKLPIRFAWAAAHERQFAVLWSLRIEFPELVDLRRLVVFIDRERAG